MFSSLWLSQAIGGSSIYKHAEVSKAIIGNVTGKCQNVIVQVENTMFMIQEVLGAVKSKRQEIVHLLKSGFGFFWLKKWNLWQFIWIKSESFESFKLGIERQFWSPHVHDRFRQIDQVHGLVSWVARHEVRVTNLRHHQMPWQTVTDGSTEKGAELHRTLKSPLLRTDEGPTNDSQISGPSVCSRIR